MSNNTEYRQEIEYTIVCPISGWNKGFGVPIIEKTIILNKK
jgi:hypothetical protein